MPRYVVPDTSALAAGLYKEKWSMNASPLLSAIRGRNIDAIAPSLGHAEFLNVSRKKSVSLDSLSVDGIVVDFFSLPIVWEEIQPLSRESWNLHRSNRIETADAYFLQLARLWDAELWTADERFAKTASAVHPKVFDLTKHPFS